MTKSFEKPLNKIATGCLVGLVCGLIAPFIVLGLILLPSLFSESTIGEMIGGFFFGSLLIMPFFGIQCAGIGAIVGTVNSMINGGVGRGVEWLFVVGIASAIGTWQWQIGGWNAVEFGVSGGIVGWIAGWTTWKLFRIEGEKRGLTKHLLLSYAAAFIGIVIVFRIFEAIMFLITL